MPHRRQPMFVGATRGAKRAAGLVRDLVNVVREVNEWRHERDAFVAHYLEEMRRRSGEARALRGPRV